MALDNRSVSFRSIGWRGVARHSRNRRGITALDKLDIHRRRPNADIEIAKGIRYSPKHLRGRALRQREIVDRESQLVVHEGVGERAGIGLRNGRVGHTGAAGRRCFQRFEHARRRHGEIDSHANDTAMRAFRTGVVRYDRLGNDAVRYDDHVMRPCPEPGRPPINLHNLAGEPVGERYPVAGSKGAFDIDRETGEHVAKRVLERQSQHDRQDARSRQEGRDRLLEHRADDTDEGEDVDETRRQIRVDAPRMGLPIIGEKCSAKRKVEQALEQPRA